MSSKVSLHTFSIKLLPLPSQGGIPGTMRRYYIFVYFLKGKEDAKNAMKSLNAKTFNQYVGKTTCFWHTILISL